MRSLTYKLLVGFLILTTLTTIGLGISTGVLSHQNGVIKERFKEQSLSLKECQVSCQQCSGGGSEPEPTPSVKCSNMYRISYNPGVKGIKSVEKIISFGVENNTFAELTNLGIQSPIIEELCTNPDEKCDYTIDNNITIDSIGQLSITGDIWGINVQYKDTDDEDQIKILYTPNAISTKSLIVGNITVNNIQGSVTTGQIDSVNIHPTSTVLNVLSAAGGVSINAITCGDDDEVITTDCIKIGNIINYGADDTKTVYIDNVVSNGQTTAIYIDKNIIANKGGKGVYIVDDIDSSGDAISVTGNIKTENGRGVYVGTIQGNNQKDAIHIKGGSKDQYGVTGGITIDNGVNGPVSLGNVACGSEGNGVEKCVSIGDVEAYMYSQEVGKSLPAISVGQITSTGGSGIEVGGKIDACIYGVHVDGDVQMHYNWDGGIAAIQIDGNVNSENLIAIDISNGTIACRETDNCVKLKDITMNGNGESKAITVNSIKMVEQSNGSDPSPYGTAILVNNGISGFMNYGISVESGDIKGHQNNGIAINTQNINSYSGIQVNGGITSSNGNAIEINGNIKCGSDNSPMTSNCVQIGDVDAHIRKVEYEQVEGTNEVKQTIIPLPAVSIGKITSNDDGVYITSVSSAKLAVQVGPTSNTEGSDIAAKQADPETGSQTESTAIVTGSITVNGSIVCPEGTCVNVIGGITATDGRGVYIGGNIEVDEEYRSVQVDGSVKGNIVFGTSTQDDEGTVYPDVITGSITINGDVVDGSVQVTGTVGGTSTQQAINIGGQITCGEGNSACVVLNSISSVKDALRVNGNDDYGIKSTQGTAIYIGGNVTGESGISISKGITTTKGTGIDVVDIIVSDGNVDGENGVAACGVSVSGVIQVNGAGVEQYGITAGDIIIQNGIGVNVTSIKTTTNSKTQEFTGKSDGIFVGGPIKVNGKGITGGDITCGAPYVDDNNLGANIGSNCVQMSSITSYSTITSGSFGSLNVGSITSNDGFGIKVNNSVKVTANGDGIYVNSVSVENGAGVYVESTVNSRYKGVLIAGQTTCGTSDSLMISGSDCVSLGGVEAHMITKYDTELQKDIYYSAVSVGKITSYDGDGIKITGDIETGQNGVFIENNKHIKSNNSNCIYVETPLIQSFSDTTIKIDADTIDSGTNAIEIQSSDKIQTSDTGVIIKGNIESTGNGVSITGSITSDNNGIKIVGDITSTAGNAGININGNVQDAPITITGNLYALDVSGQVGNSETTTAIKAGSVLGNLELGSSTSPTSGSDIISKQAGEAIVKGSINVYGDIECSGACINVQGGITPTSGNGVQVVNSVNGDIYVGNSIKTLSAKSIDTVKITYNEPLPDDDIANVIGQIALYKSGNTNPTLTVNSITNTPSITGLTNGNVQINTIKGNSIDGIIISNIDTADTSTYDVIGSIKLQKQNEDTPSVQISGIGNTFNINTITTPGSIESIESKNINDDVILDDPNNITLSPPPKQLTLVFNSTSSMDSIKIQDGSQNNKIIISTISSSFDITNLTTEGTITNLTVEGTGSLANVSLVDTATIGTINIEVPTTTPTEPSAVISNILLYPKGSTYNDSQLNIEKVYNNYNISKINAEGSIDTANVVGFNTITAKTINAINLNQTLYENGTVNGEITILGGINYPSGSPIIGTINGNGDISSITGKSIGTITASSIGSTDTSTALSVTTGTTGIVSLGNVNCGNNDNPISTNCVSMSSITNYGGSDSNAVSISSVTAHGGNGIYVAGAVSSDSQNNNNDIAINIGGSVSGGTNALFVKGNMKGKTAIRVMGSIEGTSGRGIYVGNVMSTGSESAIQADMVTSNSIGIKVDSINSVQTGIRISNGITSKRDGVRLSGTIQCGSSSSPMISGYDCVSIGKVQAYLTTTIDKSNSSNITYYSAVKTGSITTNDNGCGLNVTGAVSAGYTAVQINGDISSNNSNADTTVLIKGTITSDSGTGVLIDGSITSPNTGVLIDGSVISQNGPAIQIGRKDVQTDDNYQIQTYSGYAFEIFGNINYENMNSETQGGGIHIAKRDDGNGGDVSSGLAGIVVDGDISVNKDGIQVNGTITSTGGSGVNVNGITISDETNTQYGVTTGNINIQNGIGVNVGTIQSMKSSTTEDFIGISDGISVGAISVSGKGIKVSSSITARKAGIISGAITCGTSEKTTTSDCVEMGIITTYGGLPSFSAISTGNIISYNQSKGVYIGGSINTNSGSGIKVAYGIIVNGSGNAVEIETVVDEQYAIKTGGKGIDLTGDIISGGENSIYIAGNVNSTSTSGYAIYVTKKVESGAGIYVDGINSSGNGIYVKNNIISKNFAGINVGGSINTNSGSGIKVDNGIIVNSTGYGVEINKGNNTYAIQAKVSSGGIKTTGGISSINDGIYIDGTVKSAQGSAGITVIGNIEGYTGISVKGTVRGTHESGYGIQVINGIITSKNIAIQVDDNDCTCPMT